MAKQIVKWKWSVRLLLSGNGNCVSSDRSDTSFRGIIFIQRSGSVSLAIGSRPPGIAEMPVRRPVCRYGVCERGTSVNVTHYCDIRRSSHPKRRLL